MVLTANSLTHNSLTASAMNEAEIGRPGLSWSCEAKTGSGRGAKKKAGIAVTRVTASVCARATESSSSTDQITTGHSKICCSLHSEQFGHGETNKPHLDTETQTMARACHSGDRQHKPHADAAVRTVL